MPTYKPSWRKLLTRVIVGLSMLLGVFVIIAYSYDLYKHGKETQLIGYFSAAGFVLLTFPISLRLIFMHLTHWVQPSIQKYVVRIIWMVPLYSVESWLALRFKNLALYIETVRECYEAYVIYSFLYFLIAVLGDETEISQILRSKNKEKGTHFYPLNYCIAPWTMGAEFLVRCKVGVLQYVLIKNLTAVAVFVMEHFDVYGEGHLGIRRGYLYICIINNLSQMWALYCLLLFYNSTKEELANWRPLGKFLSVKLVVFFTWWQSLLISIAVNAIMGTEVDVNMSWTGTEIAAGIQDYLICVEMLLASIAFNYTFTYREYTIRRSIKVDDDEADDDENSSSPVGAEQEDRKPFLYAFLQSSIPDEVFTDMRRVTRGHIDEITTDIIP